METKKQEVYIVHKGTHTHAFLKEDDKVINRKTFKNNKEGKYNFEEEAKTACELLFDQQKSEEQKNKEPQKYEFKVGDIVRIRQWDDMAKDFDSNDKEIFCECIFVDEMRKLCGTLAVITHFDMNTRIKLKLLDKKFNNERWSYSLDMVEPYRVRQASFDEHAIVIKEEDSPFEKWETVKCTSSTLYNCQDTSLSEFKNENGETCLLSPDQYVVLEYQKPLLNCRFVPTVSYCGLTCGKIYEVKDGMFKDDDSDLFPEGDKKLGNLCDLDKFLGGYTGDNSEEEYYCYKKIPYVVLVE